MKQAYVTVVAMLSLAIGLLLSLPLTAQEKTPKQSVFDEIRLALATRDLQQAEALLEQAEANVTPENRAELDRLKQIHNYLGQFWTSVSNGAKTLNDVDEIVIGDSRIALVEVRPDLIILRAAGQNRRYGMKDMPAKLAVALAERALSDAKQNLVFYATFHLADKAGDRATAARLLEEAKRAGVPVAPLPDELAVKRPAIVDIEIPSMTAAMRMLLAPERWIELKANNSRVTRESLEGVQQNEEGHLIIAATAAPRLVAFETRLAANFGCRMVLNCNADDVPLGIHHSGDPSEAIVVTLPAGTNLVEIARQRGQWQCRVNGTPTEVSIPAGVSPAVAGYLGFGLPSDTECEVLALELRVR